MKQTNTKNGIIKTIILYGVVAAILAVALSALIAYLIIKEMLPIDTAQIAVAAVNAVSVLAAVLFALGRNTNQKLPTAIGIAAIYLTLILLGKLAFFPGEANGLLRTVLVTLLSAFIGALFMTKKGQRKSRTVRKR